MKKIKLNTGLKLTKESLSKLQDSQMANLKGGIDGTEYGSSGPKCTCRRDSCKNNELEPVS